MPFVDLERLWNWLRGLLARLLRRGRSPARAERPSRAGGRRRARRPPSALGTFGTRIGRHAGIYGLGKGASLLVGLVTLAVITRFLPPAEFGRYALLYFLAALLTLVYTMGWLRGGMLWVFGSGGDEDDDEDEADDSRGPGQQADDKRRALGTALLLVAATAAVGTAAVALVGPSLSRLLIGERDGGLAMLAAAAGSVWAIWMIANAVPRRERRPQAYVIVTLARPVLVLVVTVPLVAISPDVTSAVLGLALGTAAAAAVGLFVVRRSFSLTLGIRDVAGIARLGARYVPLVVSLWAIANGGVFFLGIYASDAEAGFFRLAAGVASVASLPIAAFVMAWGPLQREPIFGAVQAERGRLAANGVLATYFALASIWILLGLWIGADLLVQIAPESYAPAAPLIPLLGLALLLQAWFRVMRRTAQFPRRWAWYVGLAVVAGGVFAAACVLLIPPLGPDGAALAVVAAFATAAGAMTLRSQAGAHPVPIAYGRILVGLMVAGGCVLLARPVADAAGPAGPLVDALAVLLYPVLLVGTKTVPRAHLVPLGRMAKAVLPSSSRPRRAGLKLRELDDHQRAVVELLVRHRRPIGELATDTGLSSERIAAEFVGALRRVAGAGAASAQDGRIGAYLLSPAPVAARDQLWRRLAADGVDALEVDALSLALERLRRTPDEVWRSRRRSRSARRTGRRPAGMGASDRPSHAA